MKILEQWCYKIKRWNDALKGLKVVTKEKPGLVMRKQLKLMPSKPGKLHSRSGIDLPWQQRQSKKINHILGQDEKSWEVFYNA